MGGAPTTFTLYKNGIHVTHGNPEFVAAPALEREMRRAFDAGEDLEALLWNGALSALGNHVEVAVDSFGAIDRRNEEYPATPWALRPKR